jgi:hypothetical protein
LFQFPSSEISNLSPICLPLCNRGLAIELGTTALQLLHKLGGGYRDLARASHWDFVAIMSVYFDGRQVGNLIAFGYTQNAADDEDFVDQECLRILRRFSLPLKTTFLGPRHPETSRTLYI